MVEQHLDKVLVASSNLAPGTKINIDRLALVIYNSIFLSSSVGRVADC